MKLLIKLLFIFSFSTLFSQDLSYLNKPGFALASDIKNTSTTAYVSDSVFDVFMRKALVDQLKNKSENEIIKFIENVREKYKKNYFSTVKKTKSLLVDNGFLMDEFGLWSNVPLSWEVIESNSSNGLGTPDLLKDNISVLKCFFLFGDLDKRIVVDATVLAYNNTYSIIEFSMPVSFFNFLMEETYGVMYTQTKNILEKTLMSANSVSRMTNENPLVGEKYNEKWNKCTVQLFDENTPTLIKLNVDDDSWISSYKVEIKASIFEEINYEEGLRNLKDILGVFAQQFVISASEDNNLGRDRYINVYTQNAFSFDKKEKITTASLQLKDVGGNKIIYTLKLVMFPAKQGTYSIDMYLIEK